MGITQTQPIQNIFGESGNFPGVMKKAVDVTDDSKGKLCIFFPQKSLV